jgi:hypothetical protein
MSAITSANAYANNEVAFIAWKVAAPIKDCLGYEITRIYLSDGGEGVPKGTRRVLAAWVPFKGQKNPDWIPQNTSVWPVQKLVWRDLTIRQQRDDIAMHDEGVTIKYLIRPLIAADGTHEAVAASAAPNEDYEGAPRPLAYLDAGIETNDITVGVTHGKFKVAFNNGILATQWLKHAFEKKMKKPLTKNNLMAALKKPGNDYRVYLSGDLLPTVTKFFDDAKAANEDIYAALYELGDDQLTSLLLANAAHVHLILSNSSKDKQGNWDTGNTADRTKLINAQPKLKELHHRMFNNSGHIGHNKFLVRASRGAHPKATQVLTGSTNWTTNGLCAQTNNMLVADSADLAGQYLDYWNDILEDNNDFTEPDPLTAATSNVQGATLRANNGATPANVKIGGASVTAWRSPNTKQSTKGKAAPPDLADLFSRMRKAEQAIFFAVFLPSQKGVTSIIEQAIQLGQADPSLLVYGCVSSPMAMPNYVPTTKNEDDTSDEKTPQPTIYEEGNVHIVRASALTQGDVVGDFEAELLSAGNAIIHDKILVVDPTSPNCLAVTGSHNLGYKASYANDDNLVIIEKDIAVAQAYMVHILDLYDHYRYRAVQAEQRSEGKRTWDGFLSIDDQWQAPYLKPGKGDLSEYLG